ncbi:MAG TPA: alpha/beta hydrolase [Bacteroidales bacterium]|jgi:pimeloyl-ACP methyl ester carboxylesterase|nr:alpha/beta hydrolase [Bacteroidales bacterium]
MDKYVMSSDGLSIHYQVTGTGTTAIVFVHGWLGNIAWWNTQQKYFADKYTVVLIDLPGHGQSDKSRKNWSSKQYAADIKAVVDQENSKKAILVGHSMSGAYVLKASLYIQVVKALILVDTLKDLDQPISYSQAEQFMFIPYRKDFKSAVENMMPQYLFAKTTPVPIQKQLQSEFLMYDPELAVKVLEPLYKEDIRETAKLVQIPVRGINSDYTPTNPDSNKKYFRDYDYVTIKGTGHYPMLEQPDEFNKALEKTLLELSV